MLERAVTELNEALSELQELSRGIHPSVLTQGGLDAALKTLARRSTIPVYVDVRLSERPPEQIELAAYYAVCETLTNTAKHASASEARVDVEMRGDVLRIEVQDDGRGGATVAHGSGLVGLKDRVEALGGQLSLRSPQGMGTNLEIELPVDGSS